MPDFTAVTPLWGLAAVVIGYLLGSIPFGLLLTRWAGLGDVRSIGSGNIGATNVLRTGSKKIAAATLLCDMLKGALPVLAFRWFCGDTEGLIAGLAAFAGHLFPVWLGFKGGKGVATYLGVLFGLTWMLALGVVAVWMAMAFLFKRSSLAALTATALAPAAALLTGRAQLAGALLLLGAAIWIMHRANIARLLAGTEPKIELGAKR